MAASLILTTLKQMPTTSSVFSKHFTSKESVHDGPALGGPRGHEWPKARNHMWTPLYSLEQDYGFRNSVANLATLNYPLQSIMSTKIADSLRSV
jgi:hypothetical protein